MKLLVGVTLVVLAVAVGSFAWDRSVYDAYSRDFGQVTPAQFAAMNAQMAQLERVGRFAVFALGPLDLALIIGALRRGSYRVLGFALLLAALLGLVALAAGSATGGGMIG